MILAIFNGTKAAFYAARQFIWSACWGAAIAALCCTYAPPSHICGTSLLTEKRIIKLTKTVAYTNTGTHPVSGRLLIGIIPTLDDGQSHSQRVLSQEFSPSPQGLEERPGGSRCAVFSYSQIAPGQTVTVRQSAVAEIAALSRQLCAVLGQAGRDLQAGSPMLSDGLSGVISDRTGNTAGTERQLRRLAEQTARGEAAPWYAVVRLYDYVRSLDYRLDERPRTLAQVLRDGQVQCLDAANLLAALISCQGVAARRVTGVSLRPEEPRSAILHAWTEARLPGYGWVSLDPTMGRFPECRSSRLAQLDSSYLTLWIGGSAEDIDVWQGPTGKVSSSLAHSQLCYSAGHESLSADSRGQNLYMAALAQAVRSWGDSCRTAQAAESVPPDSGSERLEEQPGGNYSDAERALWTQPPGPERLSRLQRLYAETKQLPLFWRVMAARLAYGTDRGELIDAMTMCADCADWPMLAKIASLALTLYPDDADMLTALAHAEYRLGHIEAAETALKRVAEQSQDGYSEAVMGDLCLDSYCLEDARLHWRRALQLGLRPEEREYYEKLLRDTASAR